jgi:hypothetical protein
MAQGPYSQHFIFFLTYELAQKASVILHQATRFSSDKPSSLFGAFISYEQNEVL